MYYINLREKKSARCLVSRMMRSRLTSCCVAMAAQKNGFRQARASRYQDTTFMAVRSPATFMRQSENSWRDLPVWLVNEKRGLQNIRASWTERDLLRICRANAMTYTGLDYAAVIGLLSLGLLAVALRRRVSRPGERATIRAAAWSLLRQSQPGEAKFPNETPQRSSDVST